MRSFSEPLLDLLTGDPLPLEERRALCLFLLRALKAGVPLSDREA
jgi:hypothetical protein